MQPEDRDVARFEVLDRCAHARDRQAATCFDVGRDRARDQPQLFALDRSDLDVNELGEPRAVVLDRHAERFCDPLIRRRLAVFFELANRRADLAGELANPARHDVAAAQLVEYGTADPVLREREKRLGARLVVAVGCFDEAEHAGGHDVFARNPVGAAPCHAQRDAPGGIGVISNEPVTRERRGTAKSLHDPANYNLSIQPCIDPKLV